MSEILRMFVSKMPRVLGFVSIRPAVWGPTTLFRASRSTPPSSSEGTSTVLKPAITALAGFVPWAESGMIISLRDSSSPLSAW